MGFRNDDRRISLLVSIDGQGKFRVIHIEDNNPANVTLAAGTHAAIKKGPEFNKVTAILRSRRLEVFVNAIAVCDPISLDFDLEPVRVGFDLRGDKGHAEFERITIWSAEGLPTPEERLKKGEVPVK
jgi:hypothetical protein